MLIERRERREFFEGSAFIGPQGYYFVLRAFQSLKAANKHKGPLGRVKLSQVFPEPRDKTLLQSGI